MRYPIDERSFRSCKFHVPPLPPYSDENSSHSDDSRQSKSVPRAGAEAEAEADFDVAYEDLYQSPTIVPENVRSLPLVFIVLAMAVRLAPEEWAGDDQTRKLSSLRLYWSCELSLLYSILMVIGGS